MPRKKKEDIKNVENMENTESTESTESTEAPAEAPAEGAAEIQAAVSVEDQIAELRKKLSKARGEYKRTSGETEKKVVPEVPTSTEISVSHELNEESGFIEVNVFIGDNFVYRSFPKDTGKGIARTVVLIGGEQQHKMNNIGMQNAINHLKTEIGFDEAELDGVIYHAMKARREEIKSIDPELFATAIEIRSARKAKEKEEREAIKNEKLKAKEEQISDLEAQIAALEAQLGAKE